MAIAALLERARAGKLSLNERSIVVVDELSQVGTAQALGLLRLRAEQGFTLVAIGDDRQGQAIEAGSTIALFRKALGADAVPELASSVRQLRERDRTTTLLFREGRAAEGIARLREDGHALVVQGGHRHAVEAVAELWAVRQAANASRAGYTLTVSAPTNSDARAISAAIRERRRAAGTLGPDQVVLQATDQTGAEYELPLAVGDRVRLFDRVNARTGDKEGGNIGRNGSVLTIEAIGEAGLQLRTVKGTSGLVRWDSLRDRNSGRIRLIYGEVLTLDAIQSATSTEHINALPSGSQAVQSFKTYVGQSRARETTWLIVADGRERAEVMERRALGNIEPITEEQVWENVARNLSRQPEKELATDLLARAHEAHIGTVRSLATAFQPKQQREAQGQEGTTLHRGFAAKRDEQEVARAAPEMGAAAAQQATAVRKVAGLLTGPKENEVRKAIRAARRSVREPGSRPKSRERRGPLSRAEAQAEFAEALHRAGLCVPGPPVMDGKQHRVPVQGDRQGRLSGTYVGHLDGHPAGYIRNSKRGEEIRWKASRPARAPAPAGGARLRRRAKPERAARESGRQRREAAVSRKALALWNRARRAHVHPYLADKGVPAHGLRQDRRGNLLVPMRDVDGRLWNVQTISETGQKLYLKGARRQGTHAMLGELLPGTPLVITEGYAAAAALHEVTGLATVAAFDSGNLMDVARTYRERDPERPLIFAAGNDRHLPNRATPLPNVGLEKATAAATAVNGLVVRPSSGSADAGTDWNDFMAQHGRVALRQVVEAELSKHGIELPANLAKDSSGMPATVTQADRDAARQRASDASATATSTATRQAAQEAARRAQHQRPRGPAL